MRFSFATSAQPLTQAAPLVVTREFQLCHFAICFMHSLLALYWRHMLTFTLITNISLTSLELQSALSCCAHFPKQLVGSPAELLTLCVRLCFCLDKKKNICSVSLSLTTLVWKKVHFKDCCLLTPPQEKVIIGVAYDCVEKMVYWTEITSPSISKASIQGGEPTAVITSGNTSLLYFHFQPAVNQEAAFIRQRNWCAKCILSTDVDSPEGIAIDHLGRTMFWTDSVKDHIEVASLDGSQRRVIIDSDLVNPRAIITDPPNGWVLFHVKLLPFTCSLNSSNCNWDTNRWVTFYSFERTF